MSDAEGRAQIWAAFCAIPKEIAHALLSSFFPMQITARQNEVCNEGLLLHCTWISKLQSYSAYQSFDDYIRRRVGQAENHLILHTFLSENYALYPPT